MNPGAIYSKSGKGVQEASGKTSLLKRAERAVLSAIDGRATLAEVAQKVGKPFDAAFEALINQLDKDGFVRAVSSGEPAARSGPVPTARSGGQAVAGPDLDFTTIIPIPKTPPKPTDAAKRAKEQESALYKARQEAEARAQAERDRMKAEAEAKARAEAEAKARAEMEARTRADAERKIREETEARIKAEGEARAKAARDAALKVAAEAKAKAEAEKARLEAERAKLEAERRAREEAERRAREEAEKARREAEELRQRLEEERRAREAEEKRRREEEERRRREEEERRAREEAERKAREEAERRAREEEERRVRAEAERSAREEEERARQAREEEERARRAHEEEEERARKAHEEEIERARREAEQARAPAEPEPAPAPSAAATVVPGSLDTLMADLDSFSQREDQDRQARESAERKQKEEKARAAREESERRAREQAEAERRQAEERRRKEEESRRAQEEAERRVRDAEEARRKEAEERNRRARASLEAEQQAQHAAPSDDIGISDEDLDMEDVRRDEALVAKESRKGQREREREANEREREERQREREQERADRERERARAAEPVKPSKPRRPVKWGKPVAITLFVLLAAGIGLLHVMPIATEPYERAASEALGHPVRISSARLSLYSGVRLNLRGVKIGDTATFATARAYPELGSLFGDKKAFSRIEVESATLAPQALGEALFAKMKGANFSVGRIIVKQLKIEGGLSLPPLEADVMSGPDGAVREVSLRGPEDLLAKITPNGANIDFDVTAASFPLPMAPSVSLNSFAMKGTATRQGMNVASWGGALFDGALNGVANVRWAGGWHIDGVVTVRNINAAVFAPALLSEGRAEGTGKFSMTAQDPAKLADASRIEGKFTISKGVLGSFDLSRLIQTSGRQSSGRTQFAEMTGQGVYDRGAVALREVQISAGALNAGASADIAPSGALSGRIIADVKTATQTLRQAVTLAGTVKEPQVR